jgi:hypothetical protein
MPKQWRKIARQPRHVLNAIEHAEIRKGAVKQSTAAQIRDCLGTEQAQFYRSFGASSQAGHSAARYFQHACRFVASHHVHAFASQEARIYASTTANIEYVIAWPKLLYEFSPDLSPL